MRKSLLFVLGTVLLLTGCVGSIKKYPYGMMNPTLSLDPLERGEYVILGDVEGRAQGTEIFGIPIIDGGTKQMVASLATPQAEGVGAILRVYKDVATLGILKGRKPAQGPSRLTIVEQAALYNAMESQPEADGLVAVRITKGEMTRIPFIFKKYTVTITGKAIKIKVG
ncbi:MAG: hypothetical protein WC728_06140 [Elusimicrobiota bacterium]